jgi:hypothetical protein
MFFLLFVSSISFFFVSHILFLNLSRPPSLLQQSLSLQHSPFPFLSFPFVGLLLSLSQAICFLFLLTFS